MLVCFEGGRADSGLKSKLKAGGMGGDIYWGCCFDKGQRGHQARYSSAVCSFYTFLLWDTVPVSSQCNLGYVAVFTKQGAEQDIGGDVWWGFREYNGLKS